MKPKLQIVLLWLQAILVTIFLVFVFIPRTSVFKNYQLQASANDDYCHTDKNAKEHQETKDCQGLIYKTLDDPVALFTGGLLAFTVALAVATIQLFRVTKDGIREQAQLTRESLEKAERSTQAAEIALRGSQPPYLFPVFGAVPAENATGFPADFGATLVIGVYAQNHGTGPAVMHLVNISNIEPVDPVRPRRLVPTGARVDAVISPNQKELIIRIGINNQISSLFFIEGYFIYSDILGEFFVTRLCYAFNARNQSFIAIGSVSLNRRNKLTEDERRAVIANSRI